MMEDQKVSYNISYISGNYIHCWYFIVCVLYSSMNFLIWLELLFTTGVSKSDAEDEKKRQREEKRLARQKEIEAKRAAKKTGAMKLGSKLSWSHFYDIDTTLICGIDKPLIAFSGRLFRCFSWWLLWYLSFMIKLYFNYAA